MAPPETPTDTDTGTHSRTPGVDSGAIMVCGTSSGVGKTTVVTALCRLWADAGLDVTPFKGQNMSNHGAVTTDGGEMSRAQYMQALAARVEPDRRMNPVVLQPMGDHRSRVVVLGDEASSADAVEYGVRTGSLRHIVSDALTSLRREHDWLVAEGAGGAAEINLLDRDIVNLPLAAATGLPVLLVTDIDRGGAFASAFGTVELLPERLRHCIRGIVLNRFRGDPRLLDAGTRELTRRTGIPVLGVLPHLGDHLMLGDEDSADLDRPRHHSASCDAPVRVAVVRWPHVVNPADLDPLRLEPCVDLRWATAGADLYDADLVVVPNSRDPRSDLTWLRARSIDRALVNNPTHVVALGNAVSLLVDLGLLPPDDGPTWTDASGRVHALTRPGALDDDATRGELLSKVAADWGRFFAPSPTPYAEALDSHLDHLAGWLTRDLDVDAVKAIAAAAAPVGTEPGW